MQKKVIILTPDLSTIGGVETYYNALNLELHNPGFELFFVNSGRKESIFQLTFRLLSKYYFFSKKLLSDNYGTVLINPSLNTSSFYRDAIFCLIALAFKNLKVGVFFRGWDENLEKKIKSPGIPQVLFNLSYKRIRHFIVLSELFKNKLVEMGCNPQSKFWIETTVADDAYIKNFDLSVRKENKKTIFLLFMARVVAAKGAMVALDAFKIAKSKLLNITLELLIAGDGPDLPNLMDKVEKEQINHVHFLGYVRGKDKHHVLAKGDVFLFPTSHGEGLPNVVLEAMLYGMPILSRVNAGIPDVVLHGKNGYLTQSTEAEIFADFIVQLADNQELRQKMSVENHLKAMDTFTSDKVRERLVNIIHEIAL